jgi:hypothetical protein
MNDQIVIVANVVCWGTVVIVWVVGALYNARHAPKERIRAESRSLPLAAASFLVCSIVLFFGRGFAQSLVVDAAWVQFLGLAVLIASTAFACGPGSRWGRRGAWHPRSVAIAGSGPRGRTR